MAKKIIFTEEQEKEIIDFYLVPNSLRETCRHFKFKNKDVIKKVLEKHNIPFHSHEVCMQLKQQKATKTNLERYGVTNTYQIPEIAAKAQKVWKDNEQEIRKKMQQTSLERYGDPNYHNDEKIKQTRLERYGVENFFQNNEIHKKALANAQSNEAVEKKKQTCQKHFGTDTPLESKDVWKKIHKTIQETYGVDYISQAPKIKEKAKQTSIEKYGAPSYTQTAEYLEKRRITSLAKYGTEDPSQSDIVKAKVVATNIEKYGVPYYTQTDEYLAKAKQTNRKKYGADFYSQTKEYLKKAYRTKKENHSFNSSKQEDLFYKRLLEYFTPEDILKQYNTLAAEHTNRYPFDCDFYIKSLDLFIELNLIRTHGGHPFNLNNSNDIAILENFKQHADTSEFYRNAIDVWTVRDPLKLKMAKQNNLNYIMLYNEAEINNFFEHLKENFLIKCED